MPGPLVASLITQLFMHVPGLGWFYDRTLLAPVIAQQSRLLPLAWLLVGGILSSVSQSAWEMAQVDQLSWWQRWRTLIWRPNPALVAFDMARIGSGERWRTEHASLVVATGGDHRGAASIRTAALWHAVSRFGVVFGADDHWLVGRHCRLEDPGGSRITSGMDVQQSHQLALFVQSQPMIAHLLR